jgi:opacity protein-like surface antigen
MKANLATCFIALLVLAFTCLSPVSAADIPNDDEQDVLIRTALMTFNDANMTNDYSVFLAKSSKEFQSQFTTDKMASAFEGFRKNELYFEDVITADYDSYEKAKIDNDGALVLAGVFTTDNMEVKYRLRFIQNNKIWKVAGINVDATRKKK